MSGGVNIIVTVDSLLTESTMSAPGNENYVIKMEA